MLIKLTSWSILVIPWLSVFLLNKNIVKRYMPVALVACVLVFIWNELAYTYKWWVFSYRIFPQVITDISFVFGTLLVGTIWIFYLTFHKFWLYLLINIAMDAFLAFPINWLLEYIGLARQVNYNSWYTFFTSVSMALVLYVYQLWQEGMLKEPWQEDNNKELSVDAGKWFESKEKAR